MAPDYLTDGRLMKVTFMQLKKHLESSGVPKNDLFAASTKFALVAVAEKHRGGRGRGCSAGGNLRPEGRGLPRANF